MYHGIGVFNLFYQVVVGNFTTYLYVSQQPLDAQTAFVSLSLIQAVNIPLQFLPPAIVGITQVAKIHGPVSRKLSSLKLILLTVKLLISARAAINFRRVLDPAAIGDRRLLEIYN